MPAKVVEKIKYGIISDLNRFFILTIICELLRFLKKRKLEITKKVGTAESNNVTRAL